MEEIKFSDFKIVPDFSSVHKENIDDATYFGNKYTKFISNSRLKWINPDEGGSPQLFLNPPKLRSTCLSLGSAIHECILQPNEFYLAPKIGKPSAKLGLVMDEIDYLVHKKNNFDSLDNIIKQAALKIDYYTKTIDTKIPLIRDIWLDYNNKVEEIRKSSNGKIPIILCDSDWNVANSCIESLKSNEAINNVLFPIDVFGEQYTDVYCEDALFADFIVIYKGKQCAVLPFKLKIDNWNINTDTNTISLNDIKTTGKSTNAFMDPEGSWYHYHYYRQVGIYMSVLEMYLDREFGMSVKNGWKFEANICAVETIPNYWSRCIKINDEELHKGIIEFSQLMKRIAYYEIFGYDAEVTFV